MKTATTAGRTAEGLRYGYTTGACAAAAAACAFEALLRGRFPALAELTLGGGRRAAFPLAEKRLHDDCAMVAIIKDAGDDPDVTHGALVRARVSYGKVQSGVVVRGGEGIGRVTRPGLPVAVGEAAITPAPRLMLVKAVCAVAERLRRSCDVEVEISIPEGRRLSEKTWNARLGVVGGLSILGTSGIVTPFSCSAWVAAIHRGVDVALAAGCRHIAAATGSLSEKTAARALALPAHAMMDMGDFAGALFKYVRLRHRRFEHGAGGSAWKLRKITVAGGIGKMTKLAQGALDLHGRRSTVDFAALLKSAEAAGIATLALTRLLKEASSMAEVMAGLEEGEASRFSMMIARNAQRRVAELVGDGLDVGVMLCDRRGRVVARA